MSGHPYHVISSMVETRARHLAPRTTGQPAYDAVVVVLWAQKSVCDVCATADPDTSVPPTYHHMHAIKTYPMPGVSASIEGTI